MIWPIQLVGVVVLLIIWPHTAGADVHPTSCVEEQVLDILTKWRSGDTLPLPLPSIGAISLPSYSGQYSGYGFKITHYDTGEMTLNGVKDFIVEGLHASTDNLLALSGNILFPLLTLTSDNYSLNGRAYVFYTLKGSGHMSITFRNIRLMFKLGLRPQGEGLAIDHINLDFTVEKVQFDLVGSSWPINKVLNTEALTIINNFHESLVSIATSMLNYALNEHLSTVTPEQIQNIVVSNCLI